MQKSKRILVTGASGFIGKHLVRNLKDNGCAVIESNARIEDEKEVISLPQADIVIHLAALVGAPISWEKPQKTMDINVNGTINILEYCRDNQADILYAGSYFYGNPKYVPTDENHPITLESPYAISKFTGEELCFSYSKKYGFNAISLRVFNPYGPGQNRKQVISQMICEMLEKKQITIQDGRPKRDFLYVDDLVTAYKNALENLEGNPGVYNVGFGKNWSVEEIARMLINIHGEDIKLIDIHNERPNEILETLAGIEKIRKEFGWVPKTELQVGLRKTYDWYVGKERK